MSEQEQTSGHDLDVWGGERTAAVLVPQVGRAGNGCPCQVEGRCPPYCDACVAFMADMRRPQPTESRTHEDDAQ